MATSLLQFDLCFQTAAMLTEVPHTPLHTPLRASVQLATPHVGHTPSISQPTQADVDMEEEPVNERSMAKQQQNEALPDRLLSHAQTEQSVPEVTTSLQLSRSVADVQAVQTISVAQDERYNNFNPQLQTSSNTMEQIDCGKFRTAY